MKLKENFLHYRWVCSYSLHNADSSRRHCW